MSITPKQTHKCPSLSKKSTLTYQIGFSEDHIPHIRISGNTVGGQFAKEWINWEAIKKALNSTESPVTSIVLSKLYPQSSANCAGFLLAVLVDLKLLKAIPIAHQSRPGDAITLGQARAHARQLRAALALGGDPKGDDRRQNSSLSFSEFMEETYLPWTQENTKRSSSIKKEQHYRLHLKDVLGSKALNNITKALQDASNAADEFLR